VFVLKSKYTSWYNALILRAKTRLLCGYKERHHIIPRSIGGDDSEQNLVDLTYREHFLAHWLLTKIYTGPEKFKIIHALHCMTMGLNGRIIAGWQFEIAKRKLRAAVIERQRERARRRQERLDDELRKFKQERVTRKNHSKNLLEKYLTAPRKHSSVVRRRDEIMRTVSESAPQLNPARPADRALLRAMSSYWIDSGNKGNVRRSKGNRRLRARIIIPKHHIRQIQHSASK